MPSFNLTIFELAGKQKVNNDTLEVTIQVLPVIPQKSPILTMTVVIEWLQKWFL